MKVSRRTGVPVVEGFEGGRHPYGRNNKGAVMLRALLLTLLFVLPLSFTSYASNGAELIEAAGKGDILRVNELLAEGADVNAKNNYGVTALMGASFEGRVETVKALLAEGADVNVKDKKGITALMFTSGFGHVEIVKALMDKGADVNAKSKRGSTALMFALKEWRVEIVQLLKKAGAR